MSILRMVPPANTDLPQLASGQTFFERCQVSRRIKPDEFFLIHRLSPGLTLHVQIVGSSPYRGTVIGPGRPRRNLDFRLIFD